MGRAYKGCFGGSGSIRNQELCGVVNQLFRPGGGDRGYLRYVRVVSASNLGFDLPGTGDIPT
jgi:hypothetical protein